MSDTKFSPAEFEELLKSSNGFRNFCFLNSNNAAEGSYSGLTKYDFLGDIYSEE